MTRDPELENLFQQEHRRIPGDTFVKETAEAIKKEQRRYVLLKKSLVAVGAIALILTALALPSLIAKTIEFFDLGSPLLSGWVFDLAGIILFILCIALVRTLLLEKR